MRFLILTQYFPPEVGAPQIRLSAFARELIRQGHSVEVVTALPNYPRGRIFDEYRNRWHLRETIDGMRVHRTWVYASLGAGWKRAVSFASFAITSLYSVFKCARPDWIFVESPPLSLVLPAILAARLWRVPVIMNVADLWPDSIRALGLDRGPNIMKVLASLERFAYAQSDMITTVSDGVRQNLVQEKTVPSSKILLLENGVDPDIFRPLAVDEDLKRTLGIQDQRIVLFAGTHGFAQGLETALAAAKLLKNESIHFLFIGDGSAKAQLVQLASQRRLRNVTFLAPVNPNEVARYFSIADYGLACQRDVPLLEGNRPAKITSIMACGKPVLFAGKGEGARLVEEARGGVVVQPEDSLALANAIRNIVSNPVSAAAMGRNGRAFVQQHFMWESLVREWLTQVLAFRKSAALASRDRERAAHASVSQ
ncbi:MAG TPA: glycosyltransferase family 4 protein [Candidatus Acidoferrales bacterium]